MPIKHTLVVCGREIPTIEIDGVHYVSARCTADVFGLNWRTQKKQLLDAEQGALYGVIDISAETGLVHAQSRLGYRRSRQHIDRENAIYLRMDRVMIYIGRRSTANIRSQGQNHEGAAMVFARQLEFAQALRDYETIGIAVNKNHFGRDDLLRKKRMALVDVVNSKNRIEAKADRALLESLIGDMAGELGVPYQPNLVDAAGKAAA